MQRHPEIDTTHFHLIYATRDAKGVEAFKDAERRAMKEHDDVRAVLRTKKLERREGPSLFGPDAMGRPHHFDNLRRRHTAIARRSVIAAINSAVQIPYDDVYAAAMVHPLVWEADLKERIREAGSGGTCRETKGATARASSRPQEDENACVIVRWNGRRVPTW